ncbi:MAG: energy-coupling factor transporter transmembrane component T [Dehalococcoidia bacterium]
MTIALITTNPFYLGLVLLSVGLVAALAPREGVALSLRVLAFLGLGMLGISLLVATVNGSFGDHILFTVPGPDIPSWLGGLRLGGPVSAEGLIAAGVRGLAILCVFTAFGVLNAAVSPQRLLRSAPVSLLHAGLVVTIGLSLLPSSLDDLRRLREIHALRGASNGLRDLPALLVPAMLGGLERSMRLAEAMEARGFAGGEAQPAGRWAGWAGIGLLTAAAGAWYYYPDVRPVAAAAGLAGAGCVAAWGVLQARSQRITRLADDRASMPERALMASSVAVTFAAFALESVGAIDLAYNPFAGLAWPPIGLAGTLLALAPLWPVPLLLAGVPQPASVARPALEEAPWG